MDLNVFIGEGFVSSTPKISYVGEKGTPRCFFTLANHRGFNGNEKVYWIPCVVWGERGENIMKVLNKGSRLNVQGELVARNWKDDDGNWQSTFYVSCREVNFGNSGKGKKKEDGNAPAVAVAPEENPFDVEDDKKADVTDVSDGLDDLVDWE